MADSINDKVHELIGELNERKQQFLREMENTGRVEVKIRIREELKNLRSVFHARIDRLRNEPLSGINIRK